MLLFFDVETNGLPRNYNAPITHLKNWPRLVQIAWLLYDDSENQIASQEYLIKPKGFSIPFDVAQLHGITTEMALAQGVSLELALNEFSSAISQADYLIAHNISFDEKIVGAEFIRAKIENRLFQKPRLCTMKSSTEFCKIRPAGQGYKWPSLTELHFKLFREPFDEAHNAAIDVAACAKCFFQLRKLGVIKL